MDEVKEKNETYEVEGILYLSGIVGLGLGFIGGLIQIPVSLTTTMLALLGIGISYALINMFEKKEIQERGFGPFAGMTEWESTTKFKLVIIGFCSFVFGSSLGITYSQVCKYIFNAIFYRK